jgi:hypothetical protein
MLAAEAKSEQRKEGDSGWGEGGGEGMPLNLSFLVVDCTALVRGRLRARERDGANGGRGRVGTGDREARVNPVEVNIYKQGTQKQENNISINYTGKLHRKIT